MKIALGYSIVADRMADARAALARTDEAAWTPERRAGWLEALDAIERFVAGSADERGFSIIRTLDGTAGVDGPTSEAILAVSNALGVSGIDRFK